MRWLDGITNSKGHEFEQTLEDSKGQGCLACCCPWGHRESDMTERLNNNNKNNNKWCVHGNDAGQVVALRANV